MTDVDIWVWRVWAVDTGEVPVTDPVRRLDVTGFDVEATDGSIGKVDEATYEDGTASLVVDTGWWIFGKKRMLPAGVVDRVDPAAEKVYLRCSKHDVREAPDYEAVRANEAQYRSGVADHYRLASGD